MDSPLEDNIVNLKEIVNFDRKNIDCGSEKNGVFFFES